MSIQVSPVQSHREEVEARFFGEKWERAFFSAIQGLLANPATTMMPNAEIVEQAGRAADHAVNYLRKKVGMDTPTPPQDSPQQGPVEGSQVCTRLDHMHTPERGCWEGEGRD